MKLTLSADWELDDDRVATSYGRPVLVHRPSGETYGPGDFVTLHPFYGYLPAGEAVQRLARTRKLILNDDGQDLVARFARQPGWRRGRHGN